MRMKDKVFIVTGTARSLGRAFAERLAAEGSDVVCGDIRPCDDGCLPTGRFAGSAKAADVQVEAENRRGCNSN